MKAGRAAHITYPHITHTSHTHTSHTQAKWQGLDTLRPGGCGWHDTVTPGGKGMGQASAGEGLGFRVESSDDKRQSACTLDLDTGVPGHVLMGKPLLGTSCKRAGTDSAAAHNHPTAILGGAGCHNCGHPQLRCSMHCREAKHNNNNIRLLLPVQVLPVISHSRSVMHEATFRLSPPTCYLPCTYINNNNTYQLMGTHVLVLYRHYVFE